jgi:hypothetical protein
VFELSFDPLSQPNLTDSTLMQVNFKLMLDKDQVEKFQD